MKKKESIITIILVSCILVLSGCGMGEPIDAEQVVDDTTVVGYFNSQGYQNIISVEMEKRQTNKDDKIDNLYCQIITENETLRKIGEYEIVSNYYDEGGWIIDGIIEQSCYFEPIAEPDIFDIDYGLNYNLMYSTNANEVITESVSWPIEGYQDENQAMIQYYELYEYPNFNVENHYNLIASFDTLHGIWKATDNEFNYRKYRDLNFEGQYTYQTSDYISEAVYNIGISNLDEENMTATIEISGFVEVDFLTVYEFYLIEQHGSTEIIGYDVLDLSEDIGKMAYKDFSSGYRTLGTVTRAFDLRENEPAILFITQCSGLSSYSPNDIYNFYVLVGKNKCQMGVKTTSNSLDYDIRTLSKE